MLLDDQEIYKALEEVQFRSQVPFSREVDLAAINLGNESFRIGNAEITFSPRSLGGSSLEDIFQTVADRTDNIEIRRWLTTSSLSVKQRLFILSQLSSDEVRSFFRELEAKFDDSVEVRDFTQTKLDNLCRLLPIDVRCKVVKELLDHTGKIAPQEMLVVVLRSVNTLEELNTIVDACGEEKLLATKGFSATDLTAKSVFKRIFDQHHLPSPPSLNSDREAIDAVAKDLKETLTVLKFELLKRKDLSATETYRDLITIIDSGILAVSAPYLEKLEYSKKNALLTTLLIKLSIELHFGIQFINNGAAWSPTEMRKVESTLELLPEGLVQTTPLLFRFVRVGTLKDGTTAGERHSTGEIYITDAAIENDQLGFVVLHEFAHEIQMGPRRFYPELTDRKVDVGELRMDFAEFTNLRGWTKIEPSRFKNGGGGMLLFDSIEYNAYSSRGSKDERWITYMDDDRVMRYYESKKHGTSLYTHKRFVSTVREYGLTDPNEDYADAFAYYFYNPALLREKDPEAYRFFELEYFPKKQKI